MRIHHEFRYDAPPRDVFAMRLDPVFRDRVCRAMHTVSHEITIEETGDGMHAVIDMVQRVRGVPSFARKVVGEQAHVVATEDWPTIEGGDLELAITGKPGHIRGRLTLAGDETGSVYGFEGEAKIKIPLLGGRLEGVIEKLFVDGMDTERRIGAAWLAGDRT